MPHAPLAKTEEERTGFHSCSTHGASHQNVYPSMQRCRRDAIAACFVPEAVHYFPSCRKWVGAATIGNNFTKRVQEEGHCWTVDQLIIDADRCAAGFRLCGAGVSHDAADRADPRKGLNASRTSLGT